tara:strand:- start:6789 stop:7988 length:1200 start_codon:yes stop_codon:yes gene_type:complete
MNNLEELENKYGTPDILIDSSEEQRSRYAVWGYSDIFEINEKGSFLNNELIKGEPLEIFQQILDDWKKADNEISCLGFLSYDLNKIIYKNIEFRNQTSDHDFPYLWFCKPKFIQKYKYDHSSKIKKSKLKQVQDLMPLNHYSDKIKSIKNYLSNGDVYQINFTTNKLFKSTFDSSYELYKALRNEICAKEGLYFKTNNHDILSFSPESFIRIKNKNISTYPIKGTRPRSSNLDIDSDFKEQLVNSKKDRAEHLMIVDLMRNDLGKICETDSVVVENLYNIESFKTVHHMVSEIKGKIIEDVNEVDIIRALFPGGSITGAPKESAMKIINTLESKKRNIYTGSAGYICNNGDMYFNICIRTLLKHKNIYEYGIGGGIVWDSNPEDEWNEANQKSKILELL